MLLMTCLDLLNDQKIYKKAKVAFYFFLKFPDTL